MRKNGINPESLTKDQMPNPPVEEPRYWNQPVAVIDGRLIAGRERQDAGRGAGTLATTSAPDSYSDDAARR